MFELLEKSALGNFEKEWDGLSIEELTDHELVLLSVAQGQETGFAKFYKQHLKSGLPQPGQILAAESGSSMWLEPHKYLVMRDHRDIEADLKLASKFGDTAYAVLLSDGWTCLCLDGDRTLDVLERFIPLDLASASKDFAARTIANHISVIIAKRPNGSYHLLTPRSSAQSFLDGLVHVAENVLS